MRTTITIDEHLLAQVKQQAANSGRTVSQVVEDAVRDSLLRRAALADRPRFRVNGWHGGSPLPGVDFDNNAALLDIMEDRG